jgi:TPR repeat protein
MAYRLYMYYGMCTMAPRTVQQVDQHLERLVGRAERARGRYLEGLEYRADQTMDMYELCLPIPLEVDPRAEAVVWMTEAVRLGHEIAQVQYYEKIMGFLLRGDRWSGGPPLVLQNPDLIWEFRSTATRALESAVKNGHPEAWLAMSRAVNDGVIFEKDPVLSLAYARVAELAAMENRIILNDLAEQKFAAGQFLDEVQRAEAEELAQRLRQES